MEKNILSGDELKIFKIDFLDSFLEIETAMEETLILFFSVKDRTRPLKRDSEGLEIYNDCPSTLINTTRKMFWTHFLFPHPNFGFKEKLMSFDAILSLLSVKLHKETHKFKYFDLIESLCTARNRIAHISTQYIFGSETPYIIKTDKSIKTFSGKVTQSDGQELEIGPFHHHTLDPLLYSFDRDICKQMLEQAKSVVEFIKYINGNYSKLNKNIKKTIRQSSDFEFTLSDIFFKEDILKFNGVRLFLLNDEKREEKITELRLKDEKNTKTRKQLAEEKNERKRKKDEIRNNEK